MGRLTPQSATKLQSILSKRVGRQLSEAELEEAYRALMEFAYALIDMSQKKEMPIAKPTELYV